MALNQFGFARTPKGIVPHQLDPTLLAVSSQGHKGLLALGFLLFLWLMVGSAFPDVFQSAAGFAMAIVLLTACAIIPAPSTYSTDVRLFLLWSGIFVALGCFYVALSYFGVFEYDNSLPLRTDYIARHSYFLFFWIPFAIGGLKVWSSYLAVSLRFIGRYGLPLLLIAVMADLLTSVFLADQATREWVGYVFYLEKFSYVFLFSFIFAVRAIYYERALSSLILLFAYTLLSRLFGYGILFNATTGLIVSVTLFFTAFPSLSHRTRSLLAIGIYVTLAVACALAPFMPELSQDDVNERWRAGAWRANLASVWETNFVGVGFGTPYHQITTESLANAIENRWPDAVEPQYYRTQHSSPINMFYRLGAVGGCLFMLLNFLVVRSGLSAVGRGNPPQVQRLGLVAITMFVIQLIQMTVHVGVETPRYLVIYMLCVGLIYYIVSGSQELRLGADVTRASGSDT